MNVVPNTRWIGVPAPTIKFETAVEAESRILLLLLSQLASAQRQVARIEAEIAEHARAYADANGEFLRPTPAQLRARLGVN